MRLTCMGCGTDSDGDTCPICHKYDTENYVMDDSKPPRVVALEAEIAEAQKRFTAEDVRRISIKLLEIMKEFAPAEDEELKKAESAFALLYEALLQEEKSRNGK